MSLHHHAWRHLIAGALIGFSLASLSTPLLAHASMDADDMAKSRWTYVTQKRKNHHAHVWKLAYFEPYYTDQDNTSYYTIGWWVKVGRAWYIHRPPYSTLYNAPNSGIDGKVSEKSAQ